MRSRLHRQDDSICFLPGSVKLGHFGVLFRCNSVFKFRRGRSLGGVFLVARLGGFDPQLLFLLNWLNGLFHQFFIKDLLNNLLALDGRNLWRHAATATSRVKVEPRAEVTALNAEQTPLLSEPSTAPSNTQA